MKIVVLDGYALNPGDLSWESLEALGECRIYPRTPPALVVERSKEAAVLLTNKTVLSRSTIEQLSLLKYVGVLATGYNIVDVAAARERGILVTNVPGYSTDSVAQLTMALLLELTHHVGRHADGVANGGWVRSPDFCYWEYPLIELAGLNLGIIGLGQIGQAVARMGQAFGMNVLASTRSSKAEISGVRYCSLDALFEQADVVSLHCPLTQETQGMVNAARLGRMKRTAFLINTARGPLICEPDLAEALNTGQIAGAGLDVLSVEPPDPANPLLTAKHCLMTPHLGWATRAARERLLKTVVENLQGFLAGKPSHVIS